jgi:hypothetical protein
MENNNDERFRLLEKLMDGRERLTEQHLAAQDKKLDSLESLTKTSMGVVEREVGKVKTFVNGLVIKVLVGAIIGLGALVSVLVWKLPALVAWLATFTGK